MGLSEDDQAFLQSWFEEDIRRQHGRHAITSSTPAPPRRGDWAEWDWIPTHCDNGHELVMGGVNSSFVMCPGCPATRDDRGHHVDTCGYPGCRNGGQWWPDGHIGPTQRQS